MSEFDINKTIGIDLGTCNSCIAYWDHDHVEIVKPLQGQNNLFPTCLEVRDDGMVFGHDAAKNIRKKKNVVYEIKRIIGRSYSDRVTQECVRNWFFKVIRDDETDKPMISIPVNDEEYGYLPEDIYSQIIWHFKDYSEQYLNREITNVVVTVPAYFNNLQKEATRDSIISCDLNVIDLLNEPTAAAIAYCNQEQIINETVFVYDLGGGTFDVTILRVSDRMYEVLGCGGDSKLGGIDFTNHTADIIKEKISECEPGFNFEKHSMKINTIAEEVKVSLSKDEYATIELSEFDDNYDGEIEISREEFNQRCSELFTRTRDKVNECLSQAGIYPEQIDRVILIGGSSRIFTIDSMLKDMFRNKPVMKNINPDEAVAKGALLYAAMIAGVDTQPVASFPQAPIDLNLDSAVSEAMASAYDVNPIPPPPAIEDTIPLQQHIDYPGSVSNETPMPPPPGMYDIPHLQPSTAMPVSNIEDTDFPNSMASLPVMPPVNESILNDDIRESQIDVVLKENLRKSFVMQQPGDTFIPLFKKGEPIPGQRHFVFETLDDYASAIYINIAEGNEARFSDNDLYARIQIADIPQKPKGEVQVELLMDVDKVGMATFTARTLGEGSKEAVVNLINPMRISEQNVENMREKRERTYAMQEGNAAKKEKDKFIIRFGDYKRCLSKLTASPYYEEYRRKEEEMQRIAYDDQVYSSEQYRDWIISMEDILLNNGIKRTELSN